MCPKIQNNKHTYLHFGYAFLLPVSVDTSALNEMEAEMACSCLENQSNHYQDHILSLRLGQGTGEVHGYGGPWSRRDVMGVKHCNQVNEYRTIENM